MFHVPCFMNIIILGPQGSGKGTQAKFLAEKYNLEHIDMGGSLRQIARMDSALGRKINQLINVEKVLVPSEMLKDVLRLEVGSLGREQGLIFDGVPRAMEQALNFEEILQSFGRKVTKLVFINISEEESIKRISNRWMCEKCKRGLIMGKDVQSPNEQCPDCEGRVVQRADDTEEGVRKRLKIFREETMPVIEYFRKKEIVIEIDGERTMEEVFQDICKKLDDHN